MERSRGTLTFILAAGLFCLAPPVWAETAPMSLAVDATDAPRNLLHARLHIPAAPGSLTLFYPKWIPGEHMPSGPVNNVAGLEFTANGKPLDWQRDPAKPDLLDDIIRPLTPATATNAPAK